jgi:ATP phosphoribosyltransferase
MDNQTNSKKPSMNDTLVVAASKGRVSEKLIEMLEKAGYDFSGQSSRKLVLTDSTGKLKIVLAKSSDVLTIVENSAADLGIVGNDLLREQNGKIFEITELPIGKCDMCVAGPEGALEGKTKLRIATKYVNVAKEYLESKGLKGEIIYLNGSVELGPVLGLSDVIVDIVETGKTLKENNLVVLEKIFPISSRIIANRSYYKTKYKLCSDFVNKIEEWMNNENI